MDKNLIRFYVLALPLVIGTMLYMQWDTSRRQAAIEEQAALAPPTIVADSPADAGGANATTGSGDADAAEESDSRQMPTIVEPHEGYEPDQSAATYRDRPTDLPLEIIETESSRITFDPAGGVPVEWEILGIAANGSGSEPEDNGEGDELAEIAPEESDRGVALIDPELNRSGLDRPFEVILMEQGFGYYNEFNQKGYSVSHPDVGEDRVAIRFTSEPTESGVRLIKTYTFPREAGNYESELTLTLANGGNSRISFDDRGLGLGIALGPGLGYAPKVSGGFGGARYDYTRPFYRVSDGIEEVKQSKPGPAETFTPPADTIQWAGIHNRYFMIAVMPEADGENAEAGRVEPGFTAGIARIDAKVGEKNLASEKEVAFYPRLELYGPPFMLEPGQRRDFNFTIYAGPKDRHALAASGRGLERILFTDSFNWMRALCLMLLTMLNFFHGLTTSWGVSIVLLVITVRLLTLPLSQIGLKHQAKMMVEQAKLKPFMEKINEKYKSDPKKKQAEIMKLYREHNVNPLGMLKGCMWMIVQLPIFFALYRLVSQAYDLRGASFLWIDDLSTPDRLFALGFSLPILGSYFNLLPFLTAGTQMIVSKLSMNPGGAADPTQAAMQKQMMYFMPLMIFVMTYSFPAGLVLYWFTSNVWQLFQQQFVNKKIMGPARAAAAGKSKKKDDE